MHVFTSPHLINITERIQIAGKEISKKYFEFLLAECIKINDREELSFFELITAVAFLAFSKNKAEWTILEVGLGGRLDSTNVIKSTYLSIITPIAMDHQEFLGNNIKKIALEKGGIIKENSNLIISKQPSSALKVLKKISKNRNCDVTIYGRDFKNKKSNKSFLYSTNEKKIVLPLPLLKGSHQIDNATVAITALRKLKCRKKNLIDAVKNVYWPGRLQKIEKGKFSPKNLGIYGKIFIDGGHNGSAGVALSKWIKIQKKESKFYIIIGMMKNKNIEEFLKPLNSYINKLVAINIPLEKNSYEPDEILNRSKKLGISSKVSDSLEKALKFVSKDDSSKPKTVLITGSLYLIGYFLEINN